jgi:hypothetical protein
MTTTSEAAASFSAWQECDNELLQAWSPLAQRGVSTDHEVFGTFSLKFNFSRVFGKRH